MKNAIPAIVCCMIKLIDGEFPVRRQNERVRLHSSSVVCQRFGMQINSNHFLEIYFTLIKPDWFSHSINLNYPRRHSPSSGAVKASTFVAIFFIAQATILSRLPLAYDLCRVLLFFRLRSGPRTARP